MSELDTNFQVQPKPTTPYSDLPVFLKWLIIIGSVILGFVTIILGITTCINVAFQCILAGIILMYEINIHPKIK
jgi:hypothetical protein